MNNLEKLIDVYCQEVQAIETALMDVLTETTLDSAIGLQLDGIGKIVGVGRGSLSDDRYRDRLRAQIKLNLSSGTIPQILEILELVIPGVTLELQENFPASFTIEAKQALDTGQGQEIARLLDSAEAGGVRGLFKFFETEPVFQLDGANDSKLDGGFFLGTAL